MLIFLAGIVVGVFIGIGLVGLSLFALVNILEGKK